MLLEVLSQKILKTGIGYVVTDLHIVTKLIKFQICTMFIVNTLILILFMLGIGVVGIPVDTRICD